MTDVELLRTHSLWLSRLTLFLLMGTALIIGIHTFPVAGGTVEQARAPGAILQWLPSAFYLYALWAIRSGFREFAIGGVLGPVIAEGCIRAGISMAIGATLSAVGVPNLVRMLSDWGMINGQGDRFDGFLIFDTAYLALGVVGLALVLLGHLLRRASAIQREAASLRLELDEFF